MAITHSDICHMLPHAGAMCLLDEVMAWDDKRITCLATTHLDKHNPLRNANGLPVIALLEYGAQAMAVHACLYAQQSGQKLEEGYLAALREVKFTSEYLPDTEDKLEICAEQLFASEGNLAYLLSVSLAGVELIAGRATAVGRFSKI